MAAFTESHNHRPNYVAVYRRPPRTMRRTATAVLAGGFGWYEPHDPVSLRTDLPAPSPALSDSIALSSATPHGLDNHLVSDSASAHRRNAPVHHSRGGARAKAKAKAAGPSRPVDLGVSIIPVCHPGTGTPSPPPERLLDPEPELPSPLDHHPRLGRPPHSYASSSSSLSFDRSVSVARPPRMSDFDMGAPCAASDTAAAIVGKRSRGPSQSQRTQLPISPPVTSPNTSQSELPGSMASLPTLAMSFGLQDKSKRAREGREAGRRKRRKTGPTRGETSPASGPLSALDTSSHAEHVDPAAVRPTLPPATKPPREPPRRKGWKGWVIVSDTEGSDTERPTTPPVVILEKRTRSGRDFDQEARQSRRAPSRASTRSVRADSVAPTSSGIAT